MENSLSKELEIKNSMIWIFYCPDITKNKLLKLPNYVKALKKTIRKSNNKFVKAFNLSELQSKKK